MLRVWIGTDWIAIRNRILERIVEDVKAGKGNRVYMVPELISHDTERRLCKAAGDAASRYVEVLPFTRLARRVAEYCGSAGLECLDNGGRIVAMAAAVQQVSSQLKVYAAVVNKPEFLAAVLDIVDEFKRCCVLPEDLRAAMEKEEGSLAEKMRELSLLMSAYDAYCKRGKRDPRDRESVLLEQLEDSDFAENHTFYIDGFPDYSKQHIEIIERLIRSNADVTIGLNCDRAGTDDLAFEKAGRTAAELIRFAKQNNCDVVCEPIPGREDDLSGMCRALFQGKLPKVERGKLSVFRVESVHDEVLCAAERVMELIREEGCHYRNIGIVCGDMSAYQNAVDLVFHRCGIPIYRSGKEDILQETVIYTVTAALDAALGGMEQRDVLRYLKSVLSPLCVDICDQIENYAVIWGIRGKEWIRDWTNHPDGLGEFWTEDAQCRLGMLNKARKNAIEPLERLRVGFAEAENVGMKVRALYTFLEEINYAGQLEKLAQKLEEERDNRSAQIINQLWDILLTALEQLHDVLGDTQWDGEEFTRLFTLLLSQYDVGTIPPVLDSVYVGSASAMRCQEVEHLIILGAEEGSLPGYGGSVSLLSEQERMVLRDCNVPLIARAMDGIQGEFAEIYGVFCGATKSVTVYCSGAQPSFVYKRLTQMAGGERIAKPILGAALCNVAEAGAYLARWGAWEDAAQLGLAESYADTRRRAEFGMGTISRENVQRLYGRQLNLSASQVDCQAECRMSYFLKYGMRAKERKEATVDPAEFGTYVHAVLENTAREVMDKGGFRVISLEETMQIAMKHSEEYAAERFENLDSQRISYLFRRNRRELEMVVAELWHELKNSAFLPDDFEMRFGENGRMDAINIPGGTMGAALRGFVDRVDVWQEQGRNYFRIVDYKTGRKDFDYCDVLNGVGLQMLLYLFALEQGGYGTAAGVQYFPARAPLLSADGKLTEEEAEALRKKEWVRKGLLLRDEAVLDAMDPENWGRLCASRKKDGSISGDLADREQMKMLREYIFRWLAEMVNDIASGNVEANPYTRGTSHDACAFCPYGSICHKDSVKGRRNYRAVKPEEFWERVEIGVKRHG